MILKYELKKILTKRVNRAVLALAALIVIVFSIFAIGSFRVVDAENELHTGISACRSLSADKNLWKGELTPEVIGQAIECRRSGDWQSTNDIVYMASRMLEPQSSESFDPDASVSADCEQIANIYSIYRSNLQASADEYGYTPKQRAYINGRYEKIPIPFSYEAADSWDGMYLYAETISIVLILVIGFLTAGIFAEEFKLKSYAVYFSSRLGRSKAVRAKIISGFLIATIVYWGGIGLLSAICFSITGISGMNTAYQVYYPYSIYLLTCAQMYGTVLLGGYVGSLLAAGVSMLIAAKVRSMSVAVCAPFLLFVVSPFIGRALPFKTFFSLTPDQLINVMNCSRIPYIYQVGSRVFSQFPFIFILYIVIVLLFLLLTYRVYHRVALK